MNPIYVFYCEQCQRKVAHEVNVMAYSDYVLLRCENKHNTRYAIVDLLLCYTSHCEDTDEPKVPEDTDSLKPNRP